MALKHEGRMEEAAALWGRITVAAPASAEARANYGLALVELDRFGEAETALRDAVRLKPDAGWAHLRLANLLHATGRLSEAEGHYRTALAQDPSNPRIQLDLGHLYLGLGDYGRGWPLYEARKKLPDQNAEPLQLPNEWQGEPLAGKSILVWPEQGFGDQIQFVRFIPELVRQGADVTLVSPPELVPLFQELGVRVVTQQRELSLPRPDYWTLLLSMPHRLGVTLEALPSAPYLTVPEDRRRKWAGFAPKGAVGVVWRGRPTHPNDRHRSLPSFDLLQPLQAAGAHLIDLTEPTGDFADLAARIDQLDLLITVDTAAAHLAGALGKPTWVLLPSFKADWRWLQGREDSPWYPSARLFRGTSTGNWQDAIAEMAESVDRKAPSPTQPAG